jgi:predicted enzyme related to lactoylglutathione lyase
LGAFRMPPTVRRGCEQSIGVTSEDEDMPQQAAWWAVTVDCNEPRRVADFWCAVFECEVLEVGPDRAGWLRIQPLGSNGQFMNFQPVDEPRIGKVRIHVDVLVEDLDVGVARVAALGASDTGRREELPRGRIAVMNDPEGNEFCLLAPPRTDADQEPRRG